MSHREVPVVIVGGSLVGMFTAALLGRHGVQTLVVERHPGTAIHPRAAMIYQRSMEVMRSLGIEDVVRRKSYEQFEPDGAIMSVESIAGNELHWDIPRLNEHVRDLSPSERLFITQLALEPMLKGRAEESGASLCFNTELAGFEQDGQGVIAEVRDRASGEVTRVRAQYMVAADGAHSRVRERLGIAMRGRGVLSKSLTIYFRASVGPLMRGRNLSVILVRNREFRGFFRIEKPFESGFLVIHTIGDPDRPITDVWDLSEQRCLELLRAGLGADVPATIESIQRWVCEVNVAERMRAGRVFLAGDSAHVMPPYGGFGGNTGIHDAHNLAWKLALVLQGRAADALLSTYDEERLPVAHLTAEQAYLRYVVRGASYLGTADAPAFVKDPNVDLGFCYRSPAVSADDAGWTLHDDPRVLEGRPGSRAPHVPLPGTPAGAASTIDLFGKTFVLLTGSSGRAWAEGWRAAARELTLPLDIHALDAIHQPYGITTDGAVLVRPDGVVAWRARRAGDASPGALTRTLSTLLGHGLPAAGPPVIA